MCVLGLSKWINILMFLKISVFFVGEGRCNYGVGKGEEEFCYIGLEVKVVLWIYYIINIKICVCLWLEFRCNGI